MKYACNVSYELMNILENDSTFCDYIKIGAFGRTEALLEVAFSLKPLLIHGFGWFERGGMSSTKDIDYDKMNRYIQKYQSPFIGIHSLCFEEDARQIQNTSILDFMIQRFNDFSKHIHTDILIENMDYSSYYPYPTTLMETVKPEFICRLIDKTDLGLLLDTSHAKVSAYQLNMDIYKYLDALPLEAIREIHFSGTGFEKDAGYKDIHGIMDEEDYRIAQYLQERLQKFSSQKLEMITLEYGTVAAQTTSREAIIEQMNQLKTIFK
jgi:uncharacterized protein (UPF0276 family)